MKLMDPTPDRAKSIAPGKRILSSLSPTLVLKHGRIFAAVTPGSST
jgi:gamma-glutamyltranspeptidase